MGGYIVIYLAEEKERMDALVTAFADYIREQDYFDIVYSERIGYFRIVIKDEGDEFITRLGSFDEMLRSLIDDMLMEEDERLSGSGESQVDLDNVQGKLLDIFSSLGEDAGYCIESMERQLTEWTAENGLGTAIGRP